MSSRYAIHLKLMQCYTSISASQVAPVVKNPPANAGDTRDMGSTSGYGRSPKEGNGNPLWYFSPIKSHGQRSLTGYSQWGTKESDTTEQLSNDISVTSQQI